MHAPCCRGSMLSSQLAWTSENPSARVNHPRFEAIAWNGDPGSSNDHPRFVYASAFRLRPLLREPDTLNASKIKAPAWLDCHLVPTVKLSYIGAFFSPLFKVKTRTQLEMRVKTQRH